jgi:hypothetical protein
MRRHRADEKDVLLVAENEPPGSCRALPQHSARRRIEASRPSAVCTHTTGVTAAS